MNMPDRMKISAIFPVKLMFGSFGKDKLFRNPEPGWYPQSKWCLIKRILSAVLTVLSWSAVVIIVCGSVLPNWRVMLGSRFCQVTAAVFSAAPAPY
jgi:hypothetical protein